MRDRVTTIYGMAALLWAALVVLQVFFAGLGVFAGAENFNLHRDFGYTFGLLTLVLLILAFAGRLSGRFIGLTALLLVLFLFQSIFVALRTDLPALAALHPVNALAIFFLSQWLARSSLQFLSDRGAPEPMLERA